MQKGLQPMGGSDISPSMMISAVAILFYIVFGFLREVLQIYQQRWTYLTHPINFVTCLLYVAAFVMVSPNILPGQERSSQFLAGSLTVFLSWFNLLLNLQRFDQIGIYVAMFLEILQTLIKVLLLFSILIIAFGLAFFMLLSKVSQPQQSNSSFSTIPMALMRTFSMMLGELDYVGSFAQPYNSKSLSYPFATFTILCKFQTKSD